VPVPPPAPVIPGIPEGVPTLAPGTPPVAGSAPVAAPATAEPQVPGRDCRQVP
jgi:hypothetical protein